MLSIRLQRFGKTHFATYRVVVQDSAKHPSSGKIIAYVGNYNPHTKEASFDKEQIEKYLNNGAQPSSHMVKLLKDAKIKLPKWVKDPVVKARTVRNTEKLRKNQPVEEKVAPIEEAAPTVEAEAPVEEAVGSVTEENLAAEATEEPAE
jgi:small subunit ribosomal protein S16